MRCVRHKLTPHHEQRRGKRGFVAGGVSVVGGAILVVVCGSCIDELRDTVTQRVEVDPQARAREEQI